jgi:hypothetical protein
MAFSDEKTLPIGWMKNSPHYIATVGRWTPDLPHTTLHHHRLYKVDHPYLIMMTAKCRLRIAYLQSNLPIQFQHRISFKDGAFRIITLVIMVGQWYDPRIKSIDAQLVFLSIKYFYSAEIFLHLHVLCNVLFCFIYICNHVLSHDV